MQTREQLVDAIFSAVAAAPAEFNRASAAYLAAELGDGSPEDEEIAAMAIEEALQHELGRRGWSIEGYDQDHVIVAWGIGASRVAAIRDAYDDCAFATDAYLRWFEDLATRSRETGIPADPTHWIVAVSPMVVTASDLDADPAVAGYEAVSTNE